MKITSLLLVLACIHVSAASRAQTVSLNAKNSPLSQVFESIEKQTALVVVYNDRFVDPSMPVSIRVMNAPLTKALESLLGPVSLSYHITEGTIVITDVSTKNEHKVPIPLVESQQRTVRGRITDESGNPLEGTTVTVKQTHTKAISNAQGIYSIVVFNKNDQLVFSNVGFDTIEYTVGDQTVINVVLKQKQSNLQEVVVIGYGTVKKSDLTGSVATISGKDLETANSLTMEDVLQGQIAGVQVSANSGAPGGGMNIRIRGGNSMNGSNEPLYVIDGFPIEINENETAQDLSASDAQQYTNILSTINPSDIERIEVLKDASATAIYGSKGANGVVIITTKKGTAEAKGTDIIDVSYAFSVDNVSRKIPMLEPWEWARNYNEFIRVTGVTANHPFDGTIDVNGIYWPTVEDIKSQTNTVYGPWGVNWQDEIFQPAKTHNVNVSARGNNGTLNYAVSGNLLKNEGIIPNTSFDRITFRGNVSREFSDHFKLTANGQITHTEGNQKPTAGNTTANMGVILNSLRYNNVFPAYDLTGNYFNLRGENADDMSINHPLLFVNEVKNLLNTTSILGSASAIYEPFEGFSIQSNLNYRYSLSVRDVYFPRTTQQGATAQGLSTNSWVQTNNIINENFVSYRTTFGSSHHLEAMAGFSAETTMLRDLNLRYQGFFSDDLQGMNLSEGTLPQIPSNNFIQYNMMSYYGRVNYSFRDKYLLTATFRGDGSSKFGRDNKWAYFPSFAAAWKLNEEQFLNDVSWLSTLKLRMSYGMSGSQAIRPYQSLQLLGTEGYYFGDTYVKGTGVGIYNWTAAGGAYTGLGESGLKWETTGQLDAGLDIGFAKDRYNLVVDFYNKKTKDLHQLVRLPYESGYSNTVRNMGVIQNRGLEISFSANVPINDLRWHPSINFSMNRNKVLSLGDQYDFIYGPALISGDGGEPFIGHIARVGQPLGAFYGYLTNGIIQNDAEANEYSTSVGLLEPGEVRYVDISGPNGKKDGVVDANDRTIIGNPYPDFELNFNNRLTWRGFELGFNIAGVYGNDILNLNLNQIEAGTSSRVESVRMRDAWTVFYPSQTQPKIGPTRPKIVSDRYIEDGSYIRLRHLSLGYNFRPKSKKIRVIRLELKGTNLITLTKYLGYDPEVNQYQSNQKPGVDYGSYPPARTWTVGLSTRF